MCLAVLLELLPYLLLELFRSRLLFRGVLPRWQDVRLQSETYTRPKLEAEALVCSGMKRS